MRSIAGFGRALALLIMFVLVVPVGFADGPPIYEPPGARIHPPGGLTSPEPTFFELLVEWLRLQILPPVG